jgi:hypothetical protein
LDFSAVLKPVDCFGSQQQQEEEPAAAAVAACFSISRNQSQASLCQSLSYPSLAGSPRKKDWSLEERKKRRRRRRREKKEGKERKGKEGT